ncbi:MAG: hypothetical protein HGB21_13825, partial [Nitrospirae bacterium]|nr:hypothetical protein [Nitrospirota bacterium]
MMRYVALILLFFTFLAPAGLCAEEPELINRPVNISGMTGLIITTSPYTLPPRTVEIGAAVLSENSLIPQYTSTSYPLTISLGLGSNKELALKTQYVYRNEDPDIMSRGIDDTELSFKWNVLPQPENRNRPGLAVIVTGIFPTGDREAGTNSVNHWGCRAGLSLGSEILWEDHVIALYADGQVALQDVSDETSRDSFTLLNAGFLVPISKYRNLQMLVEFNRRSGKDLVNIDDGDYNSFTYGLRLVNERFNLTLGTQFIHKTAEGYNNSSRVLGMLSV